jgi:hypothetical protein
MKDKECHRPQIQPHKDTLLRVLKNKFRGYIVAVIGEREGGGGGGGGGANNAFWVWDHKLIMWCWEVYVMS